ncbi:uncharacterized protein LOC107884709 [Acyrthosiphon pisum]|uniref:Uncharacterized protein n=1 Tax=Acyrthosiphon pisum TaxID=7029 RepID=A0A8R2H7V4_ACYPI|nr:uncharacterized protein LOC107884709 [Acyrthosiphon pisum]|eukprot:XP_016662910.1 PREDICTED: uncharacterized protein LOC107884709 [Acyrthosiphon pisum]
MSDFSLVYQSLFPGNDNEHSDSEDISTYSVDCTNVQNSSSTASELINFTPPTTSTCSVTNDTTKRYSPYSTPTLTISAVSTSSNNHPKYGTYQPMDWTNETILQLLHTSNDGRYVLADSVSNKGRLSDDGQNTLTKLLINFLFQDKCKGTDFFFKKIAKLIVEVFPQEKERVYFIAAKTEGNHQTHAKGKLVERWKNVARRLRSIGAIEFYRKKSVPPLEKQSVFSDDLTLAKLWLQEEGLSADFKSVKEKWILTYDLRRSEILNSDTKLTLCDIFKSWPILKSPRGYELVCEDFNALYPLQKELFQNWNTFYEKWILVTDKLVNIRRTSIKDKIAKDLIKQLDNSQQSNWKVSIVLKLQLVPYLLPTKTLIRSSDPKSIKKNWKPSSGESAAAFITHIANISQLETDVAQRREKYLHIGSQIQPYIIVVGKDIFSIDETYIRVDNQLWNFSCPLKAFDSCFKAYFTFNCVYPRECYESWMFFQHHLYGLKTDYDLMTAVLSSINDQFI